KHEITGKATIYCVEKLCRKCVAPVARDACAGCTDAVFAAATSNADSCATLTCPKDRFTLDGSHILEGKAECTASTSNQSKFVWSVGGTELTKAACLDKIDCTKPPQFPCNDDKTCSDEVHPLGTDTLTCAGEYLVGYVTPSGRHNTTKLTCDTTRGKYKPEGASDGVEIKYVFCMVKIAPTQELTSAAGFLSDPIAVVALILVLLIVAAIGGGLAYYFLVYKKKKAAEAAKVKTAKTSSGQSTGNDDNKKSKQSKREKSKSSLREKVKLKNYDTWDDKIFAKKILPHFHSAKPESKLRWLRQKFHRFNAYNTAMNAPESGTIKQYWQLVKQSIDDRSEDATMWTELFRIAVLINFVCPDKDQLHARVLLPFETYMHQFVNDNGIRRKKNETRETGAMRLAAMEILLHCNNKDLIGLLRKEEFSDEMEVPLRKIVAACFCYEGGKYAKQVETHYAVFLDLDGNMPDPLVTEGWGAFHQHCIYGIATTRIEPNVVPTQVPFYEAIYEAEQPPRPPEDRRLFSPVDWVFAYRGAFLHNDTTKIAFQKFRKYNLNSFNHIEVMLKQKCEDKDDRARMRVTFQQAVKECTQMFADLVVGEDEFVKFKPHLDPVLVFIGEVAQEEEVLSEELVREKAISIGNMLRDKNFTKDCIETIDAMTMPR
ncbi:hypothetical protein PFISCL1PPCAC_1012, partial [Pristionchus fissidentatus]